MGFLWKAYRLAGDADRALIRRRKAKAKKRAAAAKARQSALLNADAHRARSTWADFADEEIKRCMVDAKTKDVPPRVASENTKRPANRIESYDSDRTALLYKRAPWRSQICFSWGIWWGMYAHEGGYICLVEYGRAVREAFSIPANSGPSPQQARDSTWSRVVVWAQHADRDARKQVP